jgi:hypothetical protein
MLRWKRRGLRPQCAQELWDKFAASPQTEAAAADMIAYLQTKDAPKRLKTQLGSTGWNAFSVNVDFATAVHRDTKNVPGSYSALLVLETEEPYHGGAS